MYLIVASIIKTCTEIKLFLIQRNCYKPVVDHQQSIIRTPMLILLET